MPKYLVQGEVYVKVDFYVHDIIEAESEQAAREAMEEEAVMDLGGRVSSSDLTVKIAEEGETNDK